MRGKEKEIKEIGYTHILFESRLYKTVGYARRTKAKKPDKKIVEMECIRKKIKGVWKSIKPYSIEFKIDTGMRYYSKHHFVKCVI